jgi:hypothetical protein
LSLALFFSPDFELPATAFSSLSPAAAALGFGFALAGVSSTSLPLSVSELFGVCFFAAKGFFAGAFLAAGA